MDTQKSSNRKLIPQSEIDDSIKMILNPLHPISTIEVIEAYQSNALEIVTEPFGRTLVNPIITALDDKKPYSVIRLGDGEINLLTFGAYKSTPNINRESAKEILSMQQDTFEADDLWLLVLQELMTSAIAQADMVGVIGVWRNKPVDINLMVSAISTKYRVVTGQWRAVDYMLKLANKGFLENKIIAPAHLYFAIINHIQEIVSHSDSVLVITDKESVYQKLNSSLSQEVKFIKVGSNIPGEKDTQPRFLFRVSSSLPDDLSGVLVLIGAGPWAEVYCTWVRQRGGVAIDIGSGFDLLAGENTRPIHRRVEVNKFGSMEYSIK